MSSLASTHLSVAAKRTSLVGACFAMLLLRTQPVAAGPSCAVVVHPERPSPAWLAAVERAKNRLLADAAGCDQVELSIEETRAEVAFTTLDGRRAVRVLRDPEDLEPTLSALLTELPAGPHAPEPAIVKPSAPPSPPPRLRLHAVGGARIAGPGPLISPTIGAGAMLSLSGWDLGVAGTWDPSYVSLSDDVTRPARISSIEAGVVVGRRVPMGKSIAFLAGVDLAAAFEHEEWRVQGDTREHESERGQMLAGAYAGAAFPTSWKTHFISTLGGDIDATHAGKSATTPEGAPALPFWGLSLVVGVEGEVL